MNRAAYNDKAGAGRITGLLLLAGLGFPVLGRAGPSCREAEEGVGSLQEGHDRQKSRHCRDWVGDKQLETGKKEAPNPDGQSMAGSLGRSSGIKVNRMQLLGLIGFPRDWLSLCRLWCCRGHGDRIDERHPGWWTSRSWLPVAVAVWPWWMRPQVSNVQRAMGMLGYA
jgi:hypothetical protein